MNSSVMNKLFKNSPNKPVMEGWGVQLVNIGIGLGFFTALAGAGVANIPLTVIGTGLGLVSYGANKHMENVSYDTVRKILNDTKVKAYIIKHCNAIYDRVSKYYGSSTARSWRFSKKVNKRYLYMESEDITNIDTDESFYKSASQQSSELDKEHRHYLFYEKIGEYTIGVYADTDHIQGIDVMFILQNLSRHTEAKLVNYNIPAPSNADIKAMGYRKE
jgi:hypothetical protein